MEPSSSDSNMTDPSFWVALTYITVIQALGWALTKLFS